MSTWSERARWLVPLLVLLMGGGVLAFVLLGSPGEDAEPAPQMAGSTATSGIRVARGEVRGTVLADGEPVAGVKVGLYAGEVATQPEVSAISDAGGRFRLVGAVPGRAYLLETSSTAPGGGRPGAKWAPSAPVPVMVDATTGLGGVELLVARTHDVRGRLVLKGGEPLPGIDVIAYRRSSEARMAAGAGRREEWARTTTDAEGRFVLSRIPDGEWNVRADEVFAVADTASVVERIRSKVEEPVEIAGDDVKVPDLVASRGRVLTGTVTDADGVPVAGAKVQVQVEAPEWVTVRETTTDERGRYRFVRLRTTTVRVGASDAFGRTGQHRAAPGSKKPTAVEIVAGQARTVADVVIAP